MDGLKHNLSLGIFHKKGVLLDEKMCDFAKFQKIKKMTQLFSVFVVYSYEKIKSVFCGCCLFNITTYERTKK